MLLDFHKSTPAFHFQAKKNHIPHPAFVFQAITQNRESTLLRLSFRFYLKFTAFLFQNFKLFLDIVKIIADTTLCFEERQMSVSL